MAFRQPRGNWASYLGAEPETFNISGNEARVHIRGTMDPQQMAIYAKGYVDSANRQYAENAAEQHRQNLVAQREAQRKRIQQEEQRQKVLARVRELNL